MIALQLIGPTGIGKSHWAKWLAEEINQNKKEDLLLFYDLDALIETSSDNAETLFLKRGPRYFWERSLQCLECVHQKTEVCVVATGAGTQWVAGYLGESSRLLAFPTCTLWSTPAFLLRYLKQKRGDQRSLEALLRVEYSDTRIDLYHRGDYFIDRTSLSEQQLQAALIDTYLKQIARR